MSSLEKYLCEDFPDLCIFFSITSVVREKSGAQLHHWNDLESDDDDDDDDDDDSKFESSVLLQNKILCL